MPHLAFTHEHVRTGDLDNLSTPRIIVAPRNDSVYIC
jgi:hypothetical protein